MADRGLEEEFIVPRCISTLTGSDCTQERLGPYEAWNTHTAPVPPSGAWAMSRVWKELISLIGSCSNFFSLVR